jgi:hypothetical protein
MALKIGRVDPMEVWLGEVRADGVTITDEDGANLATLAGTYEVYDPDGVLIYGPGPLTTSGATSLYVSHEISTGSGEPVGQPGRYRSVFTVNDSPDIWKWVGLLIVQDPTL